MKVWQQTKVMPVELKEVVPAPMELMYLWNWLSHFAAPMRYAELIAWQQVAGVTLHKWEVEAMISLDGVREYG